MKKNYTTFDRPSISSKMVQIDNLTTNSKSAILSVQPAMQINNF